MLDTIMNYRQGNNQLTTTAYFHIITEEVSNNAYFKMEHP